MTEKQKKIRFSKRDIQRLDQYPSSDAGADNKAVLDACQEVPSKAEKLPRSRRSKRVKKTTRFATRCWRACWSLIIAFVILCGIVFVLLRSGISSDMMRDEAQVRLQTLLGPQAGLNIGSALISLDANQHLALEARDIGLKNSVHDISVEKLGAVKLGLAPLPLLTGSVEVAQIELNDARLRFDKSTADAPPLIKLPYDERGLVNFDQLSREIFSGVDQTLALLDMRATKRIVLHDVTFVFHAMDGEHEVQIRDAQLRQRGQVVTLKAEFLWRGQTARFSAQMTRSDDPARAADFSLSLDNMPVSVGSPPQVQEQMANARPNPAYFHLEGHASLQLTGKAATEQQPEILTGQLLLDDATMDMGRERDIRGNIDVNFEHVAGSEKLELKQLIFNLGGLSSKFSGAFGPEPELITESAGAFPEPQSDTSPFQENSAGQGGRTGVADNQGSAAQAAPSDIKAQAASSDITAQAALSDIASKAGYRFELVSANAVSAPENSAEPPLPFGVKVAGRLMQDASRIDFNELSVKTDSGELYGQGRMIFGHGSPAMIFLLRIPSLPVAHAKQLWPLNVADGARDWVLKNLFGGILLDSQIDIALPAGHFNGPGLPPDLTESDVKADFKVENTRFDIIGDIPAVRDANGTIAVRGAHTTINLSKGAAFTPANRQINVAGGTLFIPWGRQRPVMADLDLDLQGDAAAITELVGFKPINALSKLPFSAEDVSGDVRAKVKLAFAVNKDAPSGTFTWQADLDFDKLDMNKPFNGQTVSQAKGTLSVNNDVAKIIATARLNNIPSKLTLVEPLADKTIKRQQTVRLELDEKTRETYYPGLNEFFKGPLSLDLGDAQGDSRKITADLVKTSVSLPWLGWKKGAGIPAKLTMDMQLPKDGKGPITVRNLVLAGTGFNVSGDLLIDKNELQSASISKLNLTRNDNLSLEIRKSGNGYRADVRGKSFDARALIQQAVTGVGDDNKERSNTKTAMPRIVVNAHIEEVRGFHDETLRDVTVSYETSGAKLSGVSLNAITTNNAQVSATSNNQKNASSVSLNSANAGAVLRFFDFYDKMRGGRIAVNLTSQGTGPLYGSIDARDFSIVDEPRLEKLVSSGSNGGKSLNQAVRKNIDVSRVDFERGYAQIEKGEGYLRLKNGVVRGPLIGATYQGILYDRNGNMEVTGTFMPAYGLNRLFAELPLLGVFLGNGRDRGLIGITYKLNGNAKQPNIIVNPISVIAPGIFRSIFEF